MRGAYRGRQEYEDEYDNRPANPRPYNPPKKPIKYRNESSDESDHGERNEENFSHLKAGNFADITNDSFYLQNQKDSQQQSPRNVRIVARSRPSNASRPTNSTASNGGFVPRTSVGNSGEWRPKSIRIEGNAPQQPRGYADRNNDSNQPPSRSMDRNNNGWGKPQRYEDGNENQDFEEIDETDYATNNRSNARNAWNDARSSSEFNGGKDNYSTNMRRSNENDIRGNSNERPRSAANNNRASKNYDEEQYSDRRQRNEQMIAQDDSIEELELSDHFGKSKQNNNVRYTRNDDPPVSQRSSHTNDKGSQLAFVNKSHQSSTYQEGSFHTFARSQEAAGITLPRKSGRYDEGPIEDNDDAEGSTPHDHDNHNQQEYLDNGNEDGDDIEEIPYGNDNETNNNASGRKKKQLVHKGNWTENPQLQQKSTNSSIYNYNGVNSFVLVAHPRGTRTPMVQCTIVRDRNSMHGKLYPTYELILEEPKKSLIIARKMSMNRTSNYHLFDMTRGQAGHTLSKKSGNYLGKLRSKNATRLGYTLLSSKSDREEVATILFEKVTLLDQIQDGNQPRRVKILLPRIDSSNLPVSVSAATYGAESLMDVLQAIDDHKRQIPADLLLLQTKDPVFENGNYRLNFHGRVSLPSVKNFQIVSHDDINDVKCQFGKVDKDVFHLDFKAPFTAFEAFAVALCQFNL